MIFGFNTDVKFSGTVYHVQSEARHAECLLQTQVFVQGRCLGKCATSYREFLEQPGFSEEKMHEMLKVQHRHYVQAARQGHVEEVISAASDAAETMAAVATVGTGSLITTPFASAPEPPPAPRGVVLEPAGAVMGKGIALECLPPSPAVDGTSVLVCVQVRDQSGPAVGAQLTCRIASGGAPPAYVYAQTGSGGVADLRLQLQSLDLSNTAVLLQASYRGNSASRRYFLKRG